MTTLVQFVPKWLRVRRQKPTQPKPKTVSKKDRQVLPIAPKQARSVTHPPTTLRWESECCGASKKCTPYSEECKMSGPGGSVSFCTLHSQLFT